MDKIKFAVVGCGQIGKRHASIIANHTQAELAALVDTRPFSALDISHYDTAFFSSLNAFLKSGIEADVINIATPNGLHAQQAITCLTHGKNVVIEKPMALHVKDAQQIITTANEYQKHVFVVMQNRYSPPIAWLKKNNKRNHFR